MHLAIIFVCFGFLSCLSSSSMAAPGYALEFPVQRTSDYVNVWGMRSLTQFTVCFRMKTSTYKGTPLSYASANLDNDLLIETPGNLKLLVGNSGKTTGVALDDGKMHHICVTWRNGDGQYNVYKDGELAANGNNFKTGYTINAGGSLMLGQEQDSLGGSFDVTQSMQGILKDVNVWSYELPASTIKEISGCCGAGEGDVYKWSDFIYAIRGTPRFYIEPGCSC